MTLDEARALDASDPLRGIRDRFHLPDGVIYLDGNSLGPLPRATAARMREVTEEQWGQGLIRSWNDAGWVDAPIRVGAAIAQLVGAEADEVVVADSTSVCLFKLVMAATGLREGAILAERDNFPTDLYVAERAAELAGRSFRAVEAGSLAAALTPDVAVAVLTHVDYRTAERLDLAALTARAAVSGTAIVWDLSHSVGAVPLSLGRDGIELAVGCGYKYLNGGPGAPAFLYVARRLQAMLSPPIAGWWSHAAPFEFAPHYTPAPGIMRFLSGTPSVLGLAALESGVALMRDADPDLLWHKAERLWALFVAEVERRCPTLVLRSPRDSARRGSHAAFAHAHALGVVRALIARGVIGDFRTPDIARFGFAPLYVSYEDVWRAAEAVGEVMDRREWADPRFAAGGIVT